MQYRTATETCMFGVLRIVRASARLDTAFREVRLSQCQNPCNTYRPHLILPTPARYFIRAALQRFYNVCPPTHAPPLPLWWPSDARPLGVVGQVAGGRQDVKDHPALQARRHRLLLLDGWV